MSTPSKTGVFFHPLMAEGNWPIIGQKFKDFPHALKDLIDAGRVTLFESPMVSMDLLLKCHDPQYLEGVKKAWYWEGAARSVGGCVLAAEEVAQGRLRNALVFTVAAGHHASRNYGWGGTYLSCIAPSVLSLREKGILRRFAVLDTDCHHGDGTRSFFEGDREVLHVCFCHMDYISPDGTKVDVAIPYGIGDEGYLEKVKEEFCKRAREFLPELIFHNLGHDTCMGDYGDKGLTPSFFPRLVQEVKEVAEEVCQGRYVVLTHGGSRREVARYVFTEVARILST